MNDQSICGTNYEGELEIDQESRINDGENQFNANLVEVNIEAESNIYGMENQNVVQVEADLREGNVSHIEVDTHEVNIEADSRIVGEVDTHDDNVEANLSHVGEQVGINISVEGVEAENIQEKNIEASTDEGDTSTPSPVLINIEGLIQQNQAISNFAKDNSNEMIIKALKAFKDAIAGMERGVNRINPVIKEELNGFIAKMMITLEKERKVNRAIRRWGGWWRTAKLSLIFRHVSPVRHSSGSRCRRPSMTGQSMAINNNQQLPTTCVAAAVAGDDDPAVPSLPWSSGSKLACEVGGGVTRRHAPLRYGARKQQRWM
nr:hypothetical protein Iba_chr12dCG10050 [Ipomoea batatas]